jgi:TrmH family RNA methyltransferase
MITSDKNSKIQWIKALIAHSKERKKSSAFVVEGVRLVEEAILNNFNPEFVLFSENLSNRGRELIDTFRENQISVEEVPIQLMNKIADTETPQGIIAVVPKPQSQVPEQLNFALICDAIQDPGNLGTIFRTATAAGVQTIFLGPETTDPYSPKVVRSAMGAHFHIPIIKTTWDEIEIACHERQQPLSIFLASADATQIFWQTDFTLPVAILVGNEGKGPGKNAYALANQQLSIPMAGKTESLNAAVAASILLFEIVRQRSK